MHAMLIDIIYWSVSLIQVYEHLIRIDKDLKIKIIMPMLIIIITK